MTLVTGGDGYIGSRIAGALLARGEEVAIVVRDPQSRPDVTGRLCGAGARVYQADLSEAAAIDAVPAGDVTRIVHAAAVTRFNVDVTTARAVNVEGTRAILEFASRCPSLQAVGLLSTVYASGLRGGVVHEELGDDGSGFANHYEWSKWEAERLAAKDYEGLPVRVVRMATAIADDASGTVTQRNALHNTLRLVYYGLLSVLPGDPATPVHLVSGRYATEAVIALLDDPGASGTYHLTANAGAPATLGELLDIAWERFEREPDFRRRGVLRPLFADALSFEELADATASFGSSVVAQAMATMSPFARQLYVAKHLSTVRADAALAAAGIENDDALALTVSAVDHVVSTRWGRTDGRAA